MKTRRVTLLAMALGLVLFLHSSIQSAEPNHILASVQIGKGGGCSGTIISIGPKVAFGVSASHCCQRINETFTFKNRDGTTGSARWKAFDQEADLSLFAVWSMDVKACAPVANTIQKGETVACGYPWLRQRGQFSETPQYKRNLKLHSNVDRRSPASGGNGWKYDTTTGRFADGDSGGGVFVLDENGETQLHYVMTHGTNDSYIQTCEHKQLVSFIEKNNHLFEQYKCPPMSGRDRDPCRNSSGCSNAFAQLQKKITELRKEIELLKVPGPPDAPPPPGPAGSQGPVGAVGLAGAKGDEGSAGSPGIPGADGADGADGLPGTVTIIIVDPDGQTIGEAKDLKSDSVVRLNVKRFLRKD